MSTRGGVQGGPYRPSLMPKEKGGELRGLWGFPTPRHTEEKKPHMGRSKKKVVKSKNAKREGKGVDWDPKIVTCPSET